MDNQNFGNDNQNMNQQGQYSANGQQNQGQNNNGQNQFNGNDQQYGGQNPYNNGQQFNNQNQYSNGQQFNGQNQYNNGQQFNGQNQYNNGQQFNGQNPYNNGQPGFNGYNNYPQQDDGQGLAIASLILGISSIIFWFFGSFAFLGLITGTIGVVCASLSRKKNRDNSVQIAGFVCSLIGLIGSLLVFVACIACVGCLSWSDYYWYY